jgi:hypothetical protein
MLPPLWLSRMLPPLWLSRMLPPLWLSRMLPPLPWFLGFLVWRAMAPCSGLPPNAAQALLGRISPPNPTAPCAVPLATPSTPVTGDRAVMGPYACCLSLASLTAALALCENAARVLVLPLLTLAMSVPSAGPRLRGSLCLPPPQSRFDSFLLPGPTPCAGAIGLDATSDAAGWP